MSKPLPYDPANLTVLVVDDHDPMRKAVKRILNQMGFTNVQEAVDTPEAEAILANQIVDFIIIDIYLRKGSGLQILESIRGRSLSNDIPAIVLTGESNKEDIIKASNLGADDYLLKPFQAEDLEKKISACLLQYYSPTEILGLHRAAERLILNKQYSKALAAYETILAREPESARAMYGKALVMQALGKSDDAIATLRANIVAHPQFFKSHAALANIYLAKNQPVKAMEALRNELEVNPKQLKRQLIMAKLFAEQKDWKSAMNHYRVALREGSKDKTALMGIARCYGMLDQVEKAVQVFGRVRRYHPEEKRALEAIVRLCLEKGDPKRAEFYLKDERRLHPEREDVYVQLSKLLMDTERGEEGIAVLEELLKRSPESPEALWTLAQYRMKMGEFDQALPALTQLEKLNTTLEVLVAFGQCQLHLKKYAESILLFVRACALNRAHPQVYLGLAEAHRATNQMAKAFLFFRMAIAAGLKGPEVPKQLSTMAMTLRSRALQAQSQRAS